MTIQNYFLNVISISHPIFHYLFFPKLFAVIILIPIPGFCSRPIFSQKENSPKLFGQIVLLYHCSSSIKGRRLKAPRLPGKLPQAFIYFAYLTPLGVIIRNSCFGVLRSILFEARIHLFWPMALCRPLLTRYVWEVRNEESACGSWFCDHICVPQGRVDASKTQASRIAELCQPTVF